MYSRFFVRISSLICKFWILMLAFVALFGFVSGIYICDVSDADFSSLMGVAFGHVSIVGSAFAAVFPLLLTICFVFFAKRWFILLLALVRTVLLGYSFWGIAVSCGPGGWLLSFLYFFVTVSTFPADIWLWLRYSEEGSTPGIRGFLIYLIYAAVIVALNHLMISPLLFDI